MRTHVPIVCKQLNVEQMNKKSIVFHSNVSIGWTEGGGSRRHYQSQCNWNWRIGFRFSVCFFQMKINSRARASTHSMHFGTISWLQTWLTHTATRTECVWVVREWIIRFFYSSATLLLQHRVHTRSTAHTKRNSFDSIAISNFQFCWNQSFRHQTFWRWTFSIDVCRIHNHNKV